MSYSMSDSPTNLGAHWIDTSLISDPALLDLMGSYNWTPFLSQELGSSTSFAQNAFASPTHPTAANNFELANRLGEEYTPSGTQGIPSTVRSDATSGPLSTVEQHSRVTEKPALDGIAKAKKEVCGRWVLDATLCLTIDLTFAI
jgi:hypothetical protein